MRNNKGWVELIEAAISILLVTIAILVVMNKGSVGRSDISENVYKTELSILREIETDSYLRGLILSSTLHVPVESMNIDGTINMDFPSAVRDKINARTPPHLECIGKICNLCAEIICQEGEESLPCNMEQVKETDVYSQSVVISTLLESEDPIYRRINLFCWAR